MNVEYLLYIAVPIVILAFLVVLYMFMLNIKTNMANNKIEKFILQNDKKMTSNELTKLITYMERNKKYLSPSIYRKGKNKVEQVKTRVT